MAIELRQQNWVKVAAPVPDGGVLVPTRLVMRITGLAGGPDAGGMSERDRAKLKKAAADASKMRAELSKMPAGVRSMMLAQIEKLEKMAAPGGENIAEATIDLAKLAVNEGPPYPGGTGSFEVGGMQFPNAIVVARWVERSHSDFGQLILPQSLELQSRVGEGRDAIDAWLKVKVSVPATGDEVLASAQLLSDDFPKLRFEVTVTGGYQTGDSPVVTYEERRGWGIFDGLLPYEINSHRPTMGLGLIKAPTYGAEVVIGHMPCSTAPRAIGVSDLSLEAYRGDRVEKDKACNAEFARRNEAERKRR
jgi:hypothetical protein